MQQSPHFQNDGGPLAAYLNGDQPQTSQRSQNASELSGVAQNLQSFIQNIQQTASNQLQPPQLPSFENGNEEEIIVHYPFSKRSNSQQSSHQRPQLTKQVRFDIKESLINIIKASDENDQRQANHIVPRQPKLQVAKSVSRSRSNESNERKQIKIAKGDQNSNNSDQQKPRKTFKTRKLALKYKRNADEMRRKKFGIEPPPYSCLEDTNYSSAISSTKNESRETPNFSINISRRELNSEEEDMPPMPIEQRPQQTLQAPPTMETEVLYEEINFVDQTSTAPTAITARVDPEQAIGTIVKNQTLNSYRDNSRGSSYQPGMIMRQRSSSPAQSIQLTNLAHKLKDAGPTKQQNQSVQIGQIMRNSSAQQLIISQSLPVFNFKNVVSQTSPEHSTQFSKTHSLYHESPTDVPSLTNSEAFTSHCFTTLWDILNDNSPSKKLSHLNDQSHSIRTNLLKVLSNPRAPQQMKLKQLRTSLPNLILSSLNDLSNNYLILRSKLLQRKIDLAQSLKTSGNELKSELLRDIVCRLTQKLTLNLLKLNSSLKSQLTLTFSTYYLTYIASDMLHNSLSKLKSFTILNKQKTQYISDIKKQLDLNKSLRILNVLKNIRPIREEAQKKKYEQLKLIEKHIKHRVIRAWHTGFLEGQCKKMRDQMVKEYQLHRYKRQLFIQWIYGRRQSNKIKRMALLRVTSQVEGISKGDEEWKRNADVKERDRFKERICENVGEIERIQDLIRTIKIGKGVKRDVKRGIIRKQRVQQIEKEEVVRRSMDVEIKYSIHQALVEQQNRQSSRANSGSREVIRQIQPPPSLRRCDSAQVIIPSRLMMTQASGRQQSPAPINSFFKNVDMKKPKRHRISCFDPTSKLPIQDQLKETYNNRAKQVQTYPRINHYIASLTATAQDVMNKEAFSSVIDYIQYGLSSEQSRIKFKQMFQVRVQSTLFQQWRKRYQERKADKVLVDIHAVNIAKQSLIEWQRVVLSRKLRVKEFQRTIQIQKFYSLFQKWAKWNRQQEYMEIKQVILFRKKTLFNAWTKYLEKQGNVLIKVIRSQNYYKQALLSKGMLGLYQYYLNELRAKRFRRYHCFRKLFKFTWITQFKKQSALRKILSMQINKVQTNERQKYQREFELKIETLKLWRENISSHQLEIILIQAQTHYRYQLIAKTFFHFKKLYSFTKSMSKLSGIVNQHSLKPSFQCLSSYSNTLKNSQMQFTRYRTTLTLTTLFLAWKEVSFQSKLSTLFFKKRYLRALYLYVHIRNHLLPLQNRQAKLKHVFLSTLHSTVRAKWNDKRSDIILRQLRRKQRERQMKLVIMRFTENAIQSRRQRAVEESAREYCWQTLAQKAYRVLKRRWLKQKKRRLMNQVAREFKGQRRERRQEELRESVISNASDFDIVRLRDHQVFEDPIQMMKYRVVSSWKMFLQDKMRRETVLDRFLIYKKRMMSLRCFLSWRSIAKYEQSTGVCTSAYQSTQRQIQLGTREQSREQTKRLEPNHSVKFSLDTKQFLYDPKVNLMNVTIGSQDSVPHPGHGALATFGQRSIASNYELSHQKPNPIPSESPYILRQSQQQQLGTGSLFEELETIFKKNRKWLDEQREREEFLKEMASHYNQRLSLEMSTLRFSQEQSPSLTTNSLASRKQ